MEHAESEEQAKARPHLCSASSLPQSADLVEKEDFKRYMKGETLEICAKLCQSLKKEYNFCIFQL